MAYSYTASYRTCYFSVFHGTTANTPTSENPACRQIPTSCSSCKLCTISCFLWPTQESKPYSQQVYARQDLDATAYSPFSDIAPAKLKVRRVVLVSLHVDLQSICLRIPRANRD